MLTYSEQFDRKKWARAGVLSLALSREQKEKEGYKVFRKLLENRVSAQ
jgi:hypothetical protein